MFNSDFLITTYCLEPRQKHETYRSFVSEEIMWIQHHFFLKKILFASHNNLQRRLKELSALTLSSLAWQLGVLANSLAGLQRHHRNLVFMACLIFPLDYTLGLVII